MKAWHVYKSLEGENSYLFFERIPSLLRNLIGYVDLTVFCEIWSEHSLLGMEKSVLANSFVLKIFLWQSLLQQVTQIFNSSTWQICKKIINKNKKKCWHVLRDLCFVVNTAKLICINNGIWYTITDNFLKCKWVLLKLTAFAACCRLWKAKSKTEHLLILLDCTFFFWRTPVKVWSNLNEGFYYTRHRCNCML